MSIITTRIMDTTTLLAMGITLHDMDISIQDTDSTEIHRSRFSGQGLLLYRDAEEMTEYVHSPFLINTLWAFPSRSGSPPTGRMSPCREKHGAPKVP